MSKVGVAAFSTDRARRAQICIAEKVMAEDRLPGTLKRVAGLDASYTDDTVFGAVAVLDYGSLEALETHTVAQRVQVPYIASLFAFRELPALLSCINKLKLRPDIFLVDGHGKAHPYGCGIASHLGVALKKPTIGVAKSRLFGELVKVGEQTFLMHRAEVVGAVLSTHLDTKPIYVSVGHMVSLQTATDIVRHCIRGSFRVPEPIRIAHGLAAEERKAKIAEAH